MKQPWFKKTGWG